ncbi:hypothetical protein ACLB2K_056168 [Fragaria x ananassa]
MATYRALLSLKSSLDDPESRLSALSALRLLNLSNNVFNRTFPPELSNLTNLRVLDLYNNNLTGVLPVSVATFHWGVGPVGEAQPFSLSSLPFFPFFSPEFSSLPDRPAAVCRRPASHRPPLHPSSDPHLPLSLPGLAPEPLTRLKRRKPVGNAGKHFAGIPSSGHQSGQACSDRSDLRISKLGNDERIYGSRDVRRLEQTRPQIDIKLRPNFLQSSGWI